jgi:hypothetical protein
MGKSRDDPKVEVSACERRVLLLLARPAPLDDSEYCEIFDSKIDWELHLSLLLRHGLGSLAYNHFSNIESEIVPASFLDSLRQFHHASVAWNLVLSSNLLEIIDAFRAESIPLLPYKGVVLAEGYYRGLLLRPIGDIDVVIDDCDVVKACGVLNELGYTRGEDLKSRASQVSATHHCVFERRGVPVELHWQFEPWRYHFKGKFKEFWPRCEKVTIASREIPNLAPEDALMMLSSHGARHGWKRLIWLTDIAQLIATRPQMNWETALDRAQRNGRERIVLLSLSLCQKLIVVRLPRHVELQINADRQIPKLIEMVEQRLFRLRAIDMTRTEADMFGMSCRERLADRIRFARPHRSAVQRHGEEFFPFPIRFAKAVAIGIESGPGNGIIRSFGRPLQLLDSPLKLISKLVLSVLRTVWRMASKFTG